jgi:CHAT domain-containing protein
MVRTLRLLLEKRTTRQYLPAAQALYDLLLRPLEDRLAAAGIDTLVFVPDGPLRTIPLAALHDGERFVIDRYAVATVPSLELLDPRPVGAVAITPLLNGLTEGVQGFPPLPYVDQELTGIATIFGGEELRDAHFVAPEVEDSLARTPFSVVHIASHGEFAGDPKDSFLLTYDGRLDMDQLEQLIRLSRFRDEPVELLTLSACRTAAGDDRAALGLAGVAVKAGARAALATLWFINDQASSLLVTEFYRQLAATPRPSKAEALRQAQLAIKSDPRYRHPAYWSPFLIIGNWL